VILRLHDLTPRMQAIKTLSGSFENALARHFPHVPIQRRFGKARMMSLIEGKELADGDCLIRSESVLEFLNMEPGFISRDVLVLRNSSQIYVSAVLWPSYPVR
jgi:hypothetical protein